MRHIFHSLVGIGLVGLGGHAWAQAPVELPPLPEVSLPVAAPATAPSASTAQAPNALAATTTPPVAVAAVPAVVPPAAGGASTTAAPTVNPALPVLPEKPPVKERAPGEIPYSFGDATVSVLFLPDQIEQMKRVLTTYEDQRKILGDASPIETTETVAPPVVEPPTYPVFYLSSLVYKSPTDWTVWLSGHKITPSKNDTDVQVLSVNASQATFVWYPTYNAAIITRKKESLLATPDPIKNRLAAPNFIHDELIGMFTFTLKPNQSFVVGYLSMFEGFIDSPALPALPQAAVPGAPGAPPAAPGTAAAVPAPAAPPSSPSDPDMSSINALQNRRPAPVSFGKSNP